MLSVAFITTAHFYPNSHGGVQSTGMNQGTCGAQYKGGLKRAFVHQEDIKKKFIRDRSSRLSFKHKQL